MERLADYQELYHQSLNLNKRQKRTISDLASRNAMLTENTRISNQELDMAHDTITDLNQVVNGAIARISVQENTIARFNTLFDRILSDHPEMAGEIQDTVNDIINDNNDDGLETEPEENQEETL